MQAMWRWRSRVVYDVRCNVNEKCQNVPSEAREERAKSPCLVEEEEEEEVVCIRVMKRTRISFPVTVRVPQLIRIAIAIAQCTMIIDMICRSKQCNGPTFFRCRV